MKKWILSIFLITGVLCSLALFSLDEPSGPYLGQTLPDDHPVVFAPGLVSVEGRYEYACSFSPDGRTFLFSTAYPQGGSKLMITRMKGRRWTSPREINLSGGIHKGEMEAFFTPDGSRIFFVGYEEKGCDRNALFHRCEET